MNSKSLRQFLVLAEHLHFGQASIAANVSISALSRNIKKLEEEVGVILLHRDNRSVTLTAKGIRFQLYAREALRQWSAICHEFADNREELQGQISMYCSVTASRSILFTLLNQFRPDFPGIEIKLHTGDPEHAINRILAAKEDFAIAALPRTPPRGVAFKAITVSPLLFIAPREKGELLLPSNSRTAVNEWSQVPMILSESGIARSRVNAWFRQCGVTPRIYAQVAGNEAIVSMVSLGMGIGVVPKIVLDNSPLVDSIQVLDVKPTLEPYNLGLVTLKKSLANPLVNAFWGLL